MLCHVSGSSPAEVLEPLERRLSSPEAFLLSDPEALGDLGDPAGGDPAQSHIKTFTNLKKQMHPSQAVTLQACNHASHGPVKGWPRAKLKALCVAIVQAMPCKV